MKTVRVLSALMLLFPLLFACGEKRESKNYDHLKPYLLPGARAANFEARTMENRFISFSKYRGNVIFMTVWKKKSAACVQNMVTLEKIHEKYKGRGFTSVALNADNLNYVPSGKIIDFVKEKGITYPVLLDDQNQGIERYKVINIPITFLIDRQGIINYIAYDKEDLMSPENLARIEKLL
ncbi:MAG: TlpA family protein disulfide reductase [Deltaproteobacteria bacterium]|nr:TlpA family protein disulfide reductase [Deltaproteobacteria bacterium]